MVNLLLLNPDIVNIVCHQTALPHVVILTKYVTHSYCSSFEIIIGDLCFYYEIPILNFYFFIFIYVKGKKTRESSSIHLFTPHMPATASLHSGQPSRWQGLRPSLVAYQEEHEQEAGS